MSRTVDEYTVKSAARSWLSELARRFGFEYHDMLLSMTNLNSFCGSPTVSPQLSVVRATNQEIHELAECLTGSTRYWFGQANHLGSHCYFLRHESQTAGYLWTNPDALVHQGIKLMDLPRSFAFLHSGYMLTEFRGKGLFSTLIREVYLELKHRGACYAVSLVERKNVYAMVASKSFPVIRHPAPILLLPTLKPLVFGEGFRRLRKASANLTIS